MQWFAHVVVMQMVLFVVCVSLFVTCGDVVFCSNRIRPRALWG